MRSYTICLILFISVIGRSASWAQGAPESPTSIGKGTVLTYKITDYRNIFNLIISITKFVDNGTIAFDWATDEKVPRKGHTSMKYGNLNTATNLLIKIPAADESLDPDQSRIFMSAPMTKNISDHLAEFNVDGETQSFIFINQKQETMKITYNDKVIDIDVKSGEGISMYINVMEQEKLTLLAHYYYKQYTMDLISIDNSKTEAVAPVAVVPPQGKGQPRKMGSIELIFAKIMFPQLALVEDYDPTDGGKVKQPFHETYDYRLESNGDVPPSYIDVFIVDLRYIYGHKATFKKYITGDFVLDDKHMPDTEILKVFDVYLNVNASELYGFRPWANQRFIKSLTKEEREKLAKDATLYINMYGFLEK